MPTARPVLVTGFEPFGGDGFNPSQAIAQTLDGRASAGGARIVGRTLPVVFGEAARELRTLLRQHEPRLVLCLGLAGGRVAVTPERIAINLADARLPDNRGRQLTDAPVVRGGPTAYWSTLPVKAIVAALRAEDIPAGVSHSAGTFVCNEVFYALLHTLRHTRARGLRGTRGGFVHVPYAQERLADHATTHADTPSLPFARLVRATEIVIETSLRTRRDRRQAEGTVA